MPFYVRLGPHGLIIAIGAILHTRLGRSIYSRKKRKNLRLRPVSTAQPTRQWKIDRPENLTPSAPLIHIIRHEHARHLNHEESVRS